MKKNVINYSLEISFKLMYKQHSFAFVDNFVEFLNFTY